MEGISTALVSYFHCAFEFNHYEDFIKDLLFWDSVGHRVDRLRRCESYHVGNVPP